MHPTRSSPKTTPPRSVEGSLHCRLDRLPGSHGHPLARYQRTTTHVAAARSILIEMAVLSMICRLLAFGNGNSRGQSYCGAAVGIFIAFSILGAMSAWFFYLPVAIIFGAIAHPVGYTDMAAGRIASRRLLDRRDRAGDLDVGGNSPAFFDIHPES